METFKINYKSDFVLRLQSDAGWGTAFTLEFWTQGTPTKRYYATHDGNGNYVNCHVESDNLLQVSFDDHHLGLGQLLLRITYTIDDAEFRTGKDDEVLNIASITILSPTTGEPVNVVLNLEGETAPEIQYSLPMLANEAERQANEAARQAAEAARAEAEELRELAEAIREEAEKESRNAEIQRNINETQRIANEQQRQAAEAARATEFETNEAARKETFETNEAARKETFETNEAERQAIFEENEAERQVLYEKVAKNTEDIAELGTQVIYDVSAHNDGATFASLSELLSSENLSTLIPTAVRCGGMSIRFVQSSDNKYVQYRLMTTSFSTDEAVWQGVDDEPILNSDNLVKSAGVATVSNNIKLVLDGCFNHSQALVIGAPTVILDGIRLSKGVKYTFVFTLSAAESEPLRVGLYSGSQLLSKADITTDNTTVSFTYTPSSDLYVSLCTLIYHIPSANINVSISRNSLQEMVNDVELTVESHDIELWGRNDTLVFSDADVKQQYDTLVGKTYIIQNNGSVANTVSIWVNENDSTALKKFYPSAGGSIAYTPTENAHYIKVGTATTLTIKVEGGLVECMEELETTTNNIELVVDGEINYSQALVYGESSIILDGIKLSKGVKYTFVFTLSAAESEPLRVGLYSGSQLLSKADITTDNTTVSFTYTPSLDLNDVSLRTAVYHSPSSDINVSISRNSLQEMVNDVELMVESHDIELWGRNDTLVFSDADVKQQYNTLVGKTYIIQNNGSVANAVSIWVNENDSTALKKFYPSAGGSIAYTPTENAHYIKVGTATTLTIKVEGGLVERVEELETAQAPLMTDVSTIKTGLYGVKDTLVFSDADVKQQYNTLVGKTYIIQNNGSVTNTVSIWVNENDSTALKKFYPSAGGSITYTPTENAHYIKVGTETSLIISVENSGVVDISARNKLFADYLSQGFYSLVYDDLSLSAQGLQSYYIPFCNVNDAVILSRSGNTSGFQYDVHFFFEDGTYYEQKNLSIDENAVVSLYNATQIVKRVRVYVGNNVPDGSTESMTITVVKGNRNQAKGNYQFGTNILGKVNVTNLSACPTPRNNLDTWYDLYDGLVSNYPNYISKIDLDIEATNEGIERPSYMTDYPIYMYKFMPAVVSRREPSAQVSETCAKRIKILITTGTHPEYTAIHACYEMCNLICQSWESDENIGSLRWEAEIYVIPCAGPWGVANTSRTNYNGVDLNRNMPTWDWKYAGAGTNTFSGNFAGSEYETQVLIMALGQISPDVYIDFHNFGEEANRHMMYIMGCCQLAFDLGTAHISYMSRKWQNQYTNFPSNSVSNDYLNIYGYCRDSSDCGTRTTYGSQVGCLAFTYEASASLSYQNGEYDSTLSSEDRDYTALGETLATDGFMNFILRVCKTLSGFVR